MPDDYGQTAWEPEIEAQGILEAALIAEKYGMAGGVKAAMQNPKSAR